MTFTEQELIDFHDTIKEAQEALSEDSPDSEPLWGRLEVLRARFSDERVKLNARTL
jgi:hypothetical protein